MSMVTVSPKFQVVIPKDVREQIKVHRGQKMTVVVKNGIISLVPDRPLSELRGFIRKMRSGALREKRDRL